VACAPVAVLPLSPGNSTLWLPPIIFPRWQHPMAPAYNIPPVAALCLYRTPRTTCFQWQHSPCGYRLWLPPYGVPPVAILPLSPGGSTLWLPPMVFPRWHYSAYVVRPGGSTPSASAPGVPPVVARLWLPPYDVPPVVALPCDLRPSGSTPSAFVFGVSPVIARL